MHILPFQYNKISIRNAKYLRFSQIVVCDQKSGQKSWKILVEEYIFGIAAGPQPSILSKK